MVYPSDRRDGLAASLRPPLLNYRNEPLAIRPESIGRLSGHPYNCDSVYAVHVVRIPT
jgi:hypothetical protein